MQQMIVPEARKSLIQLIPSKMWEHRSATFHCFLLTIIVTERTDFRLIFLSFEILFNIIKRHFTVFQFHLSNSSDNHKT